MGSLFSIAKFLGFDPKEAIPGILDQLLAASVAANQPPAPAP
ncbi:hypothetical protein [Prescottella agglutinans]|uniref:Uncharacterized protein n=1 Tax=Prescottella agglutinans TaxID=1644129 RepID=A0ABT6M9J1_9NOCA|nr:hypothetical protein [Prescottella agglutinans]MDH6280059.1 hypothetical protein [Prescottella agglutinans]